MFMFKPSFAFASRHPRRSASTTAVTHNRYVITKKCEAMSKSRISSKHSQDLHDVPTARSQPSGEYLDRSMVAQLGNVPQPEQQDQQAQLAASITQQLAAEQTASKERAAARAAASRASVGASAGVDTIASFLSPAMDGDESPDEPSWNST